MATPSTMRVIDAIKNTYEVLINYRSDDKDIANGTRLIQPVAYGLTKKGNPVIRAFQPDGDTTTKTPAWKFFRVDRITEWEGYKESIFEEPPGTFNADGAFNSNGDKTMSVVYNIANFNQAKPLEVEKGGPITKGNNKEIDDIEFFKTDTERGIERLKQQLKNPKMLSQELIDGDKSKEDTPSGPITKDVEDNENLVANDELGNNTDNQIDNNQEDSDNDIEFFKTDTERGIERLKQQLKNPKMLSQELLNKK